MPKIQLKLGFNALVAKIERIKMKKINQLELELLTPYLGKPEKQSGDEYFWQCPLCKDTGRDNLKFNTVKKVLWCFADESHAPQILGEIFKNNKNFTLIKPDDLVYNSYDKLKRCYTVQNQINFSEDMQMWN
ncbi:MAG: hypothetical protein LUH05_09455, partial [Candidatus Gastranaerophilales bacterium]|nr:hypothetical protein [Candidatus Gastranaerophilales bacterium]